MNSDPGKAPQTIRIFVRSALLAFALTGPGCAGLAADLNPHARPTITDTHGGRPRCVTKTCQPRTPALPVKRPTKAGQDPAAEKLLRNGWFDTRSAPRGVGE